MKKRILFLIAICLVASPAVVSEESTSSKETKIRELMRITGSGDIGVQMALPLIESMRQTMPEVPAEWWDSFAAEIKADVLVDLVVPVYAKHFEEQDIDAFLEFYRTPAGKKLIRFLPVVMQESIEIGERWGRQLAEKLIDDLETDGFDVSKLKS